MTVPSISIPCRGCNEKEGKGGRKGKEKKGRRKIWNLLGLYPLEAIPVMFNKTFYSCNKNRDAVS